MLLIFSSALPFREVLNLIPDTANDRQQCSFPDLCNWSRSDMLESCSLVCQNLGPSEVTGLASRKAVKGMLKN